VIRSEKVSRTSTPGREELKTILAFIHKGDMLVVTRLDRLARSIADLAIIVRELGAKGRIAQGKPIDTGSVAGRGSCKCSASSPSSRLQSAESASLRA
jgi:hypothetical protein